MPRYPTPDDPFDVLANLGIESAVHADLIDRLKHHPEFADLVVLAHRELIRQIAQTSPDLHAARRFAKRLDTELEKAKAAVAIAAATGEDEDLGQAEEALARIEQDFPVDICEFYLDLQEASNRNYLHSVFESMDRLLPVARFDVLARAYHLVERVAFRNLQEGPDIPRAWILEQMRQVESELPSKWHERGLTALHYYQCTRSLEDREAVLAKVDRQDGHRDLDLLCRIYTVSGSDKDWQALQDGLRQLDPLEHGMPAHQNLLLHMIEAACGHLRQKIQSGNAVVCDSFVNVELMPLYLSLGDVHKTQADIALFCIASELKYLHGAQVGLQRQEQKVARKHTAAYHMIDQLQFKLVLVAAEHGLVKQARAMAKQIPLNDPLSLVRAFAAIYASKNKAET